MNARASLFDVVASQCRSTAVGFLAMVAFFFGGLSGVVMGALSQRHGVHGFEIGFRIMAGSYVLAAIFMSVSFFVTFRRNRVSE